MSTIDDLAAEKLIEVGLLAAEQRDQARHEAAATGRPLGDVLVALGYVDAAQMENARAAASDRVRFCARCGTPVPVPRQTPQGEVCPACLGPVQWRTNVPRYAAEDRGNVALVDDEVPAEVLVARADRQRVFGKYILLGQIGYGGTGVVYKAWDTYMGEYVALKFLRTSVASESEQEQLITLLLKEARAMMRLRHENIVAIRDVGRVNKRFYIAMDYVEGNTLEEHLGAAVTRGWPSPLYESPAFYVRGLMEVALAVHHAHSLPQPIIHCDLKPANIIVSVQGTSYVMDFGIARVLGEHQEHLEMAGTPSYMAPEQATPDGLIGPWTDVYGIGAILYTLLSGRPVFMGEPMVVLADVVEKDPPYPSDVLAGREDAGRERGTRAYAQRPLLEAVCMQCLRKEPSKRYSTADEVAQQLETVLNALESGDSDVQRTLVPNAVRDAQRDARLREVDEHLTRLRLDEAQKEATRIESRSADGDVRARAADRRHHAAVLGALRKRLVERLNATRPRLAAIELQAARLAEVEVIKATDEKLVVFQKQSAIEIPWASLTAAQFVSLVEFAGLTSDEDRFGLLVYCRLARLVEPARRLAQSLEGTPFAEEAKGAM
jgi:serine/threonine protein kinase